MTETPLRSTGRWLALLLGILVPLSAHGAGTLKGVVIGPDRAPIVAARVWLTPVPPAHEGEEGGEAPPVSVTPMLAVSGEDGWFTFEGVPPGEYRLTCSREGFEPYEGGRVRMEDRPHGDYVIALRFPPEATGEDRPGLLERLRKNRERAQSTVDVKPADTKPFPNRWLKLNDLPAYQRYPGREVLDNPFQRGNPFNPYQQNPLKGDHAVIGQNTFINLTAISDTFFEMRKLPTPSGQSAAGPGSEEFFGDNHQKQGAENLLLTFEMFHGNAAFKPVDWRVRATAGLNYNYLAVRERGAVNIDVREGTDRTDDHIGTQELFGEVKLGDVGTRYDFVSLRIGVQNFLSDFRGFIFLDNQPGVRVFGSFGANRFQWNLAGFEMLEKDTNSGLNTTHLRNQRVGIANLFVQDFPIPGYTLQGSLHANVDRAGSRDEDGLLFDENGFLVRPAAVGDFTPHDLKAFYAGLTGDGHFGTLNLTNAVYFVRGIDEHDPIAGRQVQIRAKMAAVELSLDRDWLRYRASAFYSSGDSEPRDGVGTGFDSILDNPNFAGGTGSFWNRQGIRLTGTNVALVQRFSLVPDLRSSKDEGQAEFVNPGLLLYNVGADAEITPKLKLALNLNYVRLDTPEVIENLLFQAPLQRSLGFDASALVLYRPALVDNIVLSGGLSCFRPSPGFRDIFQVNALYAAFANITLTY